MRSNVLLGKIEVGFDMRQRVHQVVAQLVDTPGQVARQLSVRRLQRQFRTGLDDLGHGLSLREIQPAVEKGAAREFPGLSRPRPGGQDGVQHGPGDEHAAVT